ncbi:MAG: hypothetical protein OEZ39_11720 [Gammaproteobacteria bacterium]|nr:hypothetical protein [Gammaproteobacteria bacterium]MDH5652511.1 hypothetical protein [Gammaproteobacteria bacterium]
MSNGIRYSDEFLNAYLDNELEQADKARLLADLRRDEVLNRRLCQLQRVHNMVQLAYHDIDMPEATVQSQPKQGSRRYRFATAAAVLLLAGVTSGWFGHQYMNSSPGLVDLAGSIYNTPANQSGEWRVILHVSTKDPFKYETILDETETLLRTSSENKQKVIVQILGNSAGLAMLTDDKSSYSTRLADLQQRYPNLLLAACGKTLERLKLNNKPMPKLLSAARVVPSALNEVMQKQKEGWTYIRI